MKSFHVAAVLAAAIVAVPAPAQAMQSEVRPAVDEAKDRETLRKLSMCLAEQRPRWARATLSHPYLSEAQASVATEIVSGEDKCLRGDDVEITFRTSTIVGALAEYFVRTDMNRIDQGRVRAALATIAPLNASEDFALCVASRDPSAALNLVGSEPGSAGEATSAKALGGQVPSCTQPGEHLDVDTQAMRSLMATALYRATVSGSAS